MNSKAYYGIAMGWAILTAAGMTACSSSQSDNPAIASRSASSAQSRSASRPTPSASGMRQAQMQTKSQSSLDALRRGESPTNSAGSVLKEIYFGFDRYDLSSDARATLKAAGDWLRTSPSVRVEIEGHSDERGTSEYNLALGAKRAQAAKDYLVSLGVAPGRLSTISYGEEIPVCRDNSESCWQRNRRDRFVVLAPKPGV